MYCITLYTVMLKQELTTSKQIVEEEQKYKRECKGRALALTRNVYRLVNTDVFYVESESSNNTYYFVKFKPDVIEWCTCPDNSMRTGGQMRCKHLHAIGFAIRLGTLRDTERLPTEAKVSKVVVATTTTATIIPTAKSSYKDDDYSF
jgi:predicted nucleic acid-binding Zn finger protein